MSPDRSVLTCYPVMDLPVPAPGAIRGIYCEDCGIELWALPKNLVHGLSPVCHQCCIFEILAQHRRGEEIQVFPASDLNQRN